MKNKNLMIQNRLKLTYEGSAVVKGTSPLVKVCSVYVFSTIETNVLMVIYKN